MRHGIVANRTAERTAGSGKGFPIKWLVVGIVTLVVVAGLAFWLGQRDTIRLTSLDKELARKAELGTLTNQDLEKLVPAGIDAYEKLTGEKVQRRRHLKCGLKQDKCSH